VTSKRVAALGADVTSSKGDISLVQGRLGSVGGKLDDILRAVLSAGGTQGAPSPPAVPLPPKTRPPAPIFSGAKDGNKITTWFERFAAYASLLHDT
jgi:hypothetical protein